MLLAEYEDKVDPDTILLPGATGPHNLNTLEEFELDYSQVGRRSRRRLFDFILSISPGSVPPTRERVELRVHRGVWRQSPQLSQHPDKSTATL